MIGKDIISLVTICFILFCSCQNEEGSGSKTLVFENRCICKNYIDTSFTDKYFLLYKKKDSICELVFGNNEFSRKTNFWHYCSSTYNVPLVLEWKSNLFICISVTCGGSCRDFYFLPLNKTDSIIYKKDIIAFTDDNERYAQIRYLDRSYKLILNNLVTNTIISETSLDELALCGTFQACITKAYFEKNKFIISYLSNNGPSKTLIIDY